MSMQIQVFPCTGGFVVHKIPSGGGLSHCSAWFDSAGALWDAKLYCVGRTGKTRTIRPGSARWTSLSKIGARLLPRAEAMLREHAKAECERIEKCLDDMLKGDLR